MNTMSKKSILPNPNWHPLFATKKTGSKLIKFDLCEPIYILHHTVPCLGTQIPERDMAQQCTGGGIAYSSSWIWYLFHYIFTCHPICICILFVFEHRRLRFWTDIRVHAQFITFEYRLRTYPETGQGWLQKKQSDERDAHQTILEIRLINSRSSWLWDQYLQKKKMGILAIL